MEERAAGDFNTRAVVRETTYSRDDSTSCAAWDEEYRGQVGQLAAVLVGGNGVGGQSGR